MSQHTPDADELAIKLEERASALRVSMLRDREFIAGIQAGYEEAEQGKVVTLAELDRELNTD